MARSRAPVLGDPVASGDEVAEQNAPTWRKRKGEVEIPDEKGNLQRYAILEHPGTKKYFNIKAAMGLTDENPRSKEGKAKSELFRQIRSKIRFEFKASMTMDEWETIMWAEVGSTRKSHVAAEALEAQPYLRRFPNHWATEDLMKRILTNSRCSTKQKTKGKSTEGNEDAEAEQHKGNEIGKGDDGGKEEDGDEEGDEEEGNGKEGENREGFSEEDADKEDDDEEDEPCEPPSPKGKGKQPLIASKTPKKGELAMWSSHIAGAPTTLKRKAPQESVASKPKPNNKRTRVGMQASSKKVASDAESDWEAHVEAEIVATSTLPANPKTKKGILKKANVGKGPSNPVASTSNTSVTTKTKKKAYPKMRPPPPLSDENDTATSSGVTKASTVPGQDTFDLSRSHSKSTSQRPSRQQAGRAVKSKNA